jgi:hypothetical protein
LPVSGSITSQVRISVGSSMKGSMLAVSGSGISSMSEAWMPFQPAMEEPSKAWPSVELVIAEAGLGHGHGHVLFLATGIGKAEIDEFDVVFLDHLHNIGDSHFKLLKNEQSNSGGTTGRQVSRFRAMP